MNGWRPFLPEMGFQASASRYGPGQGPFALGAVPRGRVPGRQDAVTAGALVAPLPSSVGGWTLTLSVPPKERRRDTEAEGPNA